MVRVKVSEKNALLLAAELAKLPQKTWVTPNWVHTTYQMSFATAFGLLTTLAASGYLEVQDGWSEGETMRVRLKPSLRNRYPAVKGGENEKK